LQQVESSCATTGEKWQVRVREQAPASEKFDSHEDANNFIIKTKAAMLSMTHDDVLAVKETTIAR
jgi:hypothetical protein